MKEFDINGYRPDSTSLIIGKKYTGKTILAKHLMGTSEFEDGIVFNPTESRKEEYNNVNEHIIVQHEYNSDSLDSFIKARREKFKKIELHQDKAFVIFDDCFFDSAFVKDDTFRYLFYNNRCIKTSAIVTMQYPIIMSPSLKANIDYVFIFRDSNASSRRIIYERYAGMFDNFKDFETAMDTLGEYNCLVLDYTSHKPEDTVFLYKAPNVSVRESV